MNLTEQYKFKPDFHTTDLIVGMPLILLSYDNEGNATPERVYHPKAGDKVFVSSIDGDQCMPYSEDEDEEYDSSDDCVFDCPCGCRSFWFTVDGHDEDHTSCYGTFETIDGRKVVK